MVRSIFRLSFRPIGVLAIVILSTAFPAFAGSGEFLIGASRADITGPAGGLGMMGYADPGQKTAGIHTRLYSRAFVIEENQPGGKRVAFVSTDLAFVTQAVKLEVVRRLQAVLPGMYSDENVMLTATHTHAGPGGFSHYILFNLTIGGFSGQNFEIIVSGIVRSIVRAHQSRVAGRLLLSEGRLEGATVNRSLEPFRANPEVAQVPGLLQDQTNKTMTVLRAVDDAGRDIGMLNWFAIHGTSMSKRNHLISSDNKGFAAYLFEKRLPGVVAAFANGEEGDVSPNIYDDHWRRAVPDLESVRLSGEAQFNKAWELYEQAAEPLPGQIDYRHAWVRMAGYAVRPEFTSDPDPNRAHRLCRAGLGYSFGAGAEDGRSGVPGFYEGMRQGELSPIANPLLLLYGIASLVLAPPNWADDACQFPKPVLIASGRQFPVWTPEVLPFQLIRIGSLAWVGVPGEMTTVAGLRLRQAVQVRLAGTGVQRVLIAGLANTYSDYITTREEYALQHYEGASTLYGPDTHAAYLQIYAGLADDLKNGRTRPSPDQPRDLSDQVEDMGNGVAFDTHRWGERYGGVIVQPEEAYRPGETVRASFRTGHPSNDPLIEGSFAEVQRFEDGRWVSVARDGDPEVLFRWKHSFSLTCPACSEGVIEWMIPAGSPAGTYRITHSAARRTFFGKLKPVNGFTREFRVQ